MMVDDGRGYKRVPDLDGMVLTAMRTLDANADGAHARQRVLVRINAGRHRPVADRTLKRQRTELRLGPLLRLLCDHWATKIQGTGDAAGSRLSALSCRFHRQADVILSDYGLGRARSRDIVELGELDPALERGVVRKTV